MNRYIKSLVLSVALHSLAVIILLILFYSPFRPSRDIVTVDFSSIGYLSSEMNGHPGEGSGSLRKTGTSSGSESGIADMYHPKTVTSSRKPEKTATRSSFADRNMRKKYVLAEISVWNTMRQERHTSFRRTMNL